MNNDEAAGAARRPRVAFISRAFGARFGGAESYAERLLERLRHDFDIHVFCQAWECDLPITHTIVPALRSGPRWLRLLHFTRQCAKAARDFDLVHSHENAGAADVHGVHVMPVRYSRYFHRRSLGRWLQTVTSPRWQAYLWLEKTRYRASGHRALVAASPLIRQQIQTAYPQARDVIVIPPGVRMPANPATPAAARAALGLAPEKTYLLLVANSPVRKGYETILQAMPALHEDVHLIVVGGPEDTARQTRQLAGQAGLGPRVHVWPAQRDLNDFYSAADLFVFPTTGDAFGMVALEAMSYGVPAIMSGARHCGFAEYVRNSIDGLIIDDPRDAPALAGAVRRVLEDRDLRARLADNARALAARLGWDQVAESYAALYRRLLGERRVA